MRSEHSNKTMEEPVDDGQILQQKTHQLQERIKELNCLYGISKLVEDFGNSFDKIIQGTVNLIPISWQYPEVTSARIIIEGKVFETDEFCESIWKQAAGIKAYGQGIGSIEVYYLEEKVELAEGPFLKEERDLINAIAERLGHIYERIDTENELKDYREKMFRAEQLASLGTIGSAVAHQLNQPLSIIRMSLQKGLRDLEKPESLDVVKEMLNDSLNQVSLASSVVKGFLSLGHRSSSEKQADIEIYETAVKITKIFHEIANKTKIKMIIEDNLKRLPSIRGITSEIEQLFFILTQNAVQASRSGKSQWFKISGTAKEDSVELNFSDNCGGIAPDDFDKIFEPFFSTKPADQGTGLGLAILEQIVTNHNGSVRVESEFGYGTTFYIELPIER